MSKKLTTEEFIEKAQRIHGDKYDYSSVAYSDSRIKVEIICKKHGSFFQTPTIIEGVAVVLLVRLVKEKIKL